MCSIGNWASRVCECAFMRMLADDRRPVRSTRNLLRTPRLAKSGIPDNAARTLSSHLGADMSMQRRKP